MKRIVIISIIGGVVIFILAGTMLWSMRPKPKQGTAPPNTVFTNNEHPDGVGAEECRRYANEEERKNLAQKTGLPYTHLEYLGNNNSKTYTITEEPFRFEAVVRPEASRVVIVYKGVEHEVAGFQKGNTRWCFDFSVAGGTLQSGSNRYTVKVFYDAGVPKDGQLGSGVVERDLFIEYAIYRGVINESLNLEVSWRTQPELLPIESVLTDAVVPEDLGQSYATRGEYRNSFRVFRSGVVQTPPFQDADFLLLEQSADGPGAPSYYRIIRDHNRLIYLTKLSPQLFAEDKKLFWEAPQLDIRQLHLPNRVAFPGSPLFLVAEEFNPDIFFTDFTEFIKIRSLRDLTGIGMLHEAIEEGYFVVRIPDGTVKLYQFEQPGRILPTEESSKEGFYAGRFNELQIALASGAFRGVYSSNPMSFCPPFPYTILRLSSSDAAKRFVHVGRVEDFDIFEPRSKNDELYSEETGLVTRTPWAGGEQKNYSEEEFFAQHPILLWQDPLGRWIALRNVLLQIGAEYSCPYSNSPL
ncbi:MAG TPA: hypothetical protein VJI74_00430 [Candidatus Paceibacterota bacterium]